MLTAECRLPPSAESFHIPPRLIHPCRKIRFLPVSFQSDRLRVVLVNARNPLNIGAAARAMSNFGFRNLREVNPIQVAFQDARSAVGTSCVLARAEQCTTVAGALADCTLVVVTTAVRHRDFLTR